MSLLCSVQVPQEQVVAKTVEIPLSLLGEKIVAIPEVWTIQGTRTSESSRKSDVGVSIHSVVFEVSVSSDLLASLVVMRQCVPWMIKLCEWSTTIPIMRFEMPSLLLLRESPVSC